jgi:tRNA A37 threonylcarbamoyladenosine modification protein TsaB
MKLPNGASADLGTKLEDYTLNPNHLEGRYKARAFSSALGITLHEIETLRAAVLSAARTSEDAVARGHNGFGNVYVLRFEMTSVHGTAVILTAWIIRDGEDFPRLTTCYIV